MHVDAAEARQVEGLPTEDQAVGGDHEEIGIRFGELPLNLRIAQRRRLGDGQA